MKCSDLRNNHNEPSNDQWSFRNSNYGLTYNEVISQRENRSWSFMNSQQGGPDIRYISDPLNPNIVIDLRHLLIVGKLGRVAGESIELMQLITNNPSGYDDQDFYSNELGYSFFQHYGEAIKYNPNAIADYLISFLNNPKIETQYHHQIDVNHEKNFNICIPRHPDKHYCVGTKNLSVTKKC